MPRFFTDVILNDIIEITGNDAKHINKVLRMSVGDFITVCDLKGFDYKCKIKSQEHTKVILKIEKKIKSSTEPNIQVALYQGVPKGDKFDKIVQKSVELGVNEIIPVFMHRCIPEIEAKSQNKKIERYNRIALEAAKQSNRSKMPIVKPFISFVKAIEDAKNFECSVLFYEKSVQPFKPILKNNKFKNISIIIGPEGGFEESEVDVAKSLGINIASMGKRILRCETAPLYALSSIMFEFEN